MEEIIFPFEKLTLWQKAAEFSGEILDLCENLQTDKNHWRLVQNLEAAAISIPANIAEGKGRYSKKEFVHFIFISRGSLYEVITILIVFHKKSWVKTEKLNSLKKQAEEINKMISSLVKSIKGSDN